MAVRRPQFPTQVWDGTADDRDSRLIDAFPLHPTYDQIAAELIATQQYVTGLVGGLSTPYSAEAGVNVSEGNPVYLDVTGRLQLARNDTVAGYQVAGLVYADALATASGDYVSEGPLELLDWTGIAGTASLVKGALYYLDSSPGMITTIAPTIDGYYVVPVGRALTDTTLDIELGQPVRL